MKKIPYKNINDEDEFWCGSVFRKAGTNLNNPLPEEDFFEYMLFLDNGETDWMLCAHIDKWEKGTIIAHVKMNKGNGRLTVKAKEFKRSMIRPEEINLWYYIDDGIRETRIKSNK